MCQKYKPVTHVIFDCDGLLLDTESLFFQVDVEIVAKYGKKISSSLHAEVLGCTGMDKAIIFVRELSLPITPLQYRTQIKELFKNKIPLIELKPGAERLIQHLHKNNVPMAIATSSTIEGFNEKTGRHREIFDLFSHVVAAGSDIEVKQGKPAPDVFLACAERFPDSVDPSMCLVFEDSLNGIMAAHSAGMQSVLVPEYDIPECNKKFATVLIKSLNDFCPEWFSLPPFFS